MRSAKIERKKQTFGSFVQNTKFLFINESRHGDHNAFCKLCGCEVNILYCNGQKEGNMKAAAEYTAAVTASTGNIEKYTQA